MNEFQVSILFAAVVAGAAPIILATLGETITERAGLINLSLDGSILLSAMAAFVTAYLTHSVAVGFIIGALVGALVAVLVAVFSIYLSQSQVAVGFVLTLMARDLAYFIGNPYSRLQGPQVMPLPIPLLADIPFFGPVFFNHNWPVYLSLVCIGILTWYMYRTPMGLALRAVGEHPKAVFARGMDPKKLQLFYAVCGGLLVGLAGATFSLSTKPGWGRPQGAEGTGWIALALVIFGGWHPVKAAIGAYLFSFLQVMGIYLQGWLPSIPTQVFQVAPFPLMIFTLLLISLAQKEAFLARVEKMPWIRPFIQMLSGTPPSALGKPHEAE
ncbi:MAG: ABC transporter permease [Desulfobacteraceae bacterium]|nr:ABC transporter permease [Desulfobacteraceae bacterium]